MARISVVTLLLVVVSGCQLVGPDSDRFAKTYPEALDAEYVALEALIDAVAVPGTYNVDVYVVGIRVCPENYMCFLPDGITIAEHPSDTSAVRLMLASREPHQFRLSGRYVMSISVVHSTRQGQSDTSARPRLTLEGYSRRIPGGVE